MDTDVITAPKNEADLEDMLCKTLARSYMSPKIYNDKKLDDTVRANLDSGAKHFRLGMTAYLKAGQALFARKQRCGYGLWLPWLKANDIHYKKADRLISVALWWSYFPEHHPETGNAWSFNKSSKQISII